MTSLVVMTLYTQGYDFEVYLGRTQQEATLAILEVHGQSIASYNNQALEDLKASSPDYQMKVIQRYFGYDDPNTTEYWHSPWIKYSNAKLPDGMGEIPNWISDEQKVVIARTDYVNMYEEAFPRYDWDSVRKWWTDEKFLILYEAHEKCLEDINDMVGDPDDNWDEFWEETIEESYWDTIELPVKDGWVAEGEDEDALG